MPFLHRIVYTESGGYMGLRVTLSPKLPSLVGGGVDRNDFRADWLVEEPACVCSPGGATAGF